MFTLPLKVLDIDDFIKVYKKEMEIYLHKLRKQKDVCKYLEKENEKLDIEGLRLSEKIKKELNIIEKILEERGLNEKLYEEKDAIIFDNIQKNFKLSTKNNYKMVKKIKKSKNYYDYYDFSNKQISLVKKGSKKYFQKKKKLNKLNCHNLFRINKYSILKQFNFVPKIIEVILGKKDITYIFEYIEGKILGEYIKDKSDKDLENLKKKIIEMIKILEKKKIYYEHNNFKNDIIINKNGKIYLTGIHIDKFRNNTISEINNDLERLFANRNKKKKKTDRYDYFNLQTVIDQMIKKGIIKV